MRHYLPFAILAFTLSNSAMLYAGGDCVELISCNSQISGPDAGPGGSGGASTSEGGTPKKPMRVVVVELPFGLEVPHHKEDDLGIPSQRGKNGRLFNTGVVIPDAPGAHHSYSATVTSTKEVKCKEEKQKAGGNGKGGKNTGGECGKEQELVVATITITDDDTGAVISTKSFTLVDKPGKKCGGAVGESDKCEK